GQLRWARAAPRRRPPKAVFDDAVLTRVIREHDAATTRNEQLDGVVEGVAEDVELTVDLDADRLERATGRVAAVPAGSRGDRVAHDVGQLGGGRQGPGGHDCPSDASGEALLAVFPQYPAQAFLGITVDDIGSRAHAAGVHPHVERSFTRVGEAAPRV